MSVPTSAEWLELTPDEFFERRDACPVCYMPYGYPEAHGVYNPLGVDFYISTAVVRRAAYGDVTAAFPVTILQNHPDALIYVNAVASEQPL